MSTASDAFDGWIRTGFVQMNTELEALYFVQDDRSNVDGTGDAIKAALHAEGDAHAEALASEGNTGGGFDSAFDVLGNVGLYMAAMRRHELTNPAREERSPLRAASSLALQAGASIGMAPRMATAHLTTRNRAIGGVRKSFTSLSDEFLFIDENARAIAGMQRAADALYRIQPLGIGNPVADGLLSAAAAELRAVAVVNARLAATLNTDRFFFSVRPYYKPYRVGRQEFRGANGGDFSGINELDLALGLLSARDPSYAHLITDKMSFMPPSDQARLRECMQYPSLLDLLLAEIEGPRTPALETNARLLLEVTDAFADTARQHHHLFVERYVAGPSEALAPVHKAQVTASGPPLEVLMRALEGLRDARTAAPGLAGSRDADHRKIRRWLAKAGSCAGGSASV
ncbi:tryptophan 2,3-dioxygenase KynA [Polymorphobacter glacialis]|uniref:Tryptophan 2,3-dioxygenase KynA n=1 Tax=Sandarakinorhabdus glacialis TaxID=1614636 RepID=A0A916ZVU5_9SPHN|nr:monodechloroaminopyrrolnitrin synthase PrnB family protein [Polymorphobacter glacialis]GGE16361.1 tryptophan 2,3-dioxygenase KynA [Polymorphobacter glacialis]